MDIQKMMPGEFDRYEKESDLARKEGRRVQGYLECFNNKLLVDENGIYKNVKL